MKILIGTDQGSYTFNALSKTVTLTNLPTLTLDQVLLITNITNNEIIYSPIITGKGGVISNNIITLSFDTTNMNNSDELQIFVSLNKTMEVSYNSDSLDAFGALTINSPVVSFESNLSITSDNTSWQVVSTTGATGVYMTHSSSFDMTVGTNSGSSVIRQQHGYNYYIPGVSCTILMTARLSPGELGLTQRVGYYDPSDGIYFEQKDNVNKFVLRSTSSGTSQISTFTQSSWNIDTLDGSNNENNQSGIQVDLTKAQIFFFDFQWLGVGRIRYGFVIDGKRYIVHEVNNANNIETTYMSSPNLPCRYEILLTSGITGTRTMKSICCSVQHNNNKVPRSNQFSISNGTTSKSISSGVRTSLLSIRLSPSINNKINRIKSIVQELSVMTTSNASVILELVIQKCNLNEVNIGGTPTWNSVGNSGMEVSLDVTTVTGGDVLWSGYISDRTRDQSTILDSPKDFLCNNIDASQSDHLHLVATPLSNASLFASLKISQIR